MAYGLTKFERKYALKKLEYARSYLDNHFVEFGNKSFPLSDFTKNAYVNSGRYIASIYNRVYSLHKYAQINGLVNVFVTLTLPSEWHKYKTIKTKSGKEILVPNKNYIEFDEDGIMRTPKQGSKELTKMLKSIFDTRVYKSIDKEKRCYFRVTEPHKDGTPHLHISFFIPPDKVEKFKSMIENKFPSPASKVEINVNNPVAYLMKYILKTLDDLRKSPDDITDLSLWYIYHGICRFYTSRTLIAIEVYDKLLGSKSLLQLTHMYKDNELNMWYDENGRLMEITEGITMGFGVKHFVTIWQRIDSSDWALVGEDIKSFKAKTKLTYKSKFKLKEENEFVKIYVDGLEWGYLKDNEAIKKVIYPALLSDKELLAYYWSLDPDDPKVNYTHYGITREELKRRGIINEPPTSLNEYKI